MMKPELVRTRVFVVFVFALTAGGAFAFATYRYVNNQAQAPATNMKTTHVVVAAANLTLGDELGADDLRVVEWPANSVPASAFHTTEEVVGRGVVAPIVEHEPILPDKLASKDAGAGLPPAIPEGKRALSVSVNEVIGVAGYVLPGTRVDVLATVNPSQNQTDVMSKVILTNVPVLAAGTKIERDGTDNKPIAVTVVTLLVDPAEAERLTLASTEGKIQLALRNPLDTTAPPTPGIRPAALLGATRAPAPAPAARPAAPVRKVAAAPVAPPPTPAAPPPPTVEIIRGDKRAQEPVRQE
jgi:pilus assembly protein CpaB